MKLVERLIWFVLKRLLAWLGPGRLPAARAAWLRRQGARIGEGCWIHSDQVLSEPFLLELGDRVGVSAGTVFVTHDGSLEPGPHRATFGRITVGNDTFIGCSCLILPGTAIGRGCIVGAGSVVRGTVPDGAVVLGNPARVVMTTAMARKLATGSRDLLEIGGLSAGEREQLVRDRLGVHVGVHKGG